MGYRIWGGPQCQVDVEFIEMTSTPLPPYPKVWRCVALCIQSRTSHQDGFWLSNHTRRAEGEPCSGIFNARRGLYVRRENSENLKMLSSFFGSRTQECQSGTLGSNGFYTRIITIPSRLEIELVRVGVIQYESQLEDCSGKIPA